MIFLITLNRQVATIKSSAVLSVMHITRYVFPHLRLIYWVAVG